MEINDEFRGTYNGSNQIKFKTPMIKVNFWDYNDAYIYAKGTITVPNTETAAVRDNRNKKVGFKNCAPFINCISEIK